jgi:hypothetical protein
LNGHPVLQARQHQVVQAYDSDHLFVAIENRKDRYL